MTGIERTRSITNDEGVEVKQVKFTGSDGSTMWGNVDDPNEFEAIRAELPTQLGGTKKGCRPVTTRIKDIPYFWFTAVDGYYWFTV